MREYISLSGEGENQHGYCGAGPAEGRWHGRACAGDPETLLLGREREALLSAYVHQTILEQLAPADREAVWARANGHAVTYRKDNGISRPAFNSRVSRARGTLERLVRAHPPSPEVMEVLGFRW